MDSACPIAIRAAGQPTYDAGTTFTVAMRTVAKAESFTLDWLGSRSRHEYHEAHHPQATGYRQLA